MRSLLGGHTNSYHIYSLDDALRGIAGAGYKYVELAAVPGWNEQVDLHQDARAILGKLDALGLLAISLSAHSDLTTRAGITHATRAIYWAAEAGIGIVNTAIGGHASQSEDEDAFFRHIDQVADVADDAGIIVALEVHGNIMSSGEQALAVLKRIGRESIRLNYDTGNAVFYGDVDPAHDLEIALEHVAHVHLKDKIGGKGVWNFPALGDGMIDFIEVLRTLERGGYSGPLSVELEFQGDPWPPLGEVDEAMQRSLEFIHECELSVSEVEEGDREAQ